MRRSIFALTALSSLALWGCEDGPNQTFSPLPANGGDLINNGNTDASVDPSTSALDASFPTKSRQEICGADLKHARWSKMVQEPIKPPRVYAGIDMAHSDQWEGLTIEEAEQAPDPVTLEGGNCQSISLGFSAGDSGTDGVNYWGDNQEVQFLYHVDTHVVDQMVLQLGYIGAMTFHDRAMQHQYIMRIGDTWQKCDINGNNCQPYIIDWSNTTNRDTQITELCNAMMITFGPDAGVTNWQDSKNCRKDGTSLVISDDGTGVNYFGVRPLAVYINAHAGQPNPIPSQPFQLYNFFVKNEPYGNLPMTLQINNTGAIAQGQLSAKNPNTPCVLTAGNVPGTNHGLYYKDFVANCVQTSMDPKVNDQNLNKLLGGRTHDLENFTFNVVGVNQNFTHQQGQFDYIKDADLPGDQDLAKDWIFDVRAKGHPVNDFDSTGAEDDHGTGLVFREWQRLVLNDATRILNGHPAGTIETTLRHQPGDTACVGADVSKFPADCTGFETLILPGIPYPGDSAGIQSLYDPGFGVYGVFLKPSDPKSVFCSDLGSYGNCVSGAIWDTALQWVVSVMGRGSVYHVPAEMRDRRFYFKWYATALVKYLKAYGTYGANLTPAQVAAQSIDYDSLFFDNNGGNQFDQAEYIERSYMTAATDEPWDFAYGSDVKVANQRYTNWYHRMDREEKAMFTALLPAGKKSAPPGSVNNIMLTNLAGSILLSSTWDSYACATTGVDANNTCDVVGTNPKPPQRINPDTGIGEPLLKFYPGAWGPTIFHIGNSPIQILEKYPQVQAVKARLPNFADPYNTVASSTNTPTPLDALVPWFDAINGNGFTIPITGTRDKQIVSQTLDFTGVLETYLIDFEQQTDPAVASCNTDADCNSKLSEKCDANYGQIGKCRLPTIKIDAIEASDFLGEVFLCKDPNTGDILHVGQYTSSSYILDWVNTHPGVIDACDMIIRYSPYNNYLDYITSRANGVKVSINQGQGFGRVVDALVFDPVFINQ